MTDDDTGYRRLNSTSPDSIQKFYRSHGASFHIRRRAVQTAKGKFGQGAICLQLVTDPGARGLHFKNVARLASEVRLTKGRQTNSSYFLPSARAPAAPRGLRSPAGRGRTHGVAKSAGHARSRGNCL
jgi:hypothetical protein|eukprot:COSAG06_NODE_19476_length_836_cov_1.735414_1_plen_127_part_00